MDRDDDKHIHLHLHLDGATFTVNHVMSPNAELFALIRSIKKDIATMDADVQAAVDDLTATVTEETSVNQSAVTLINGFAAQLAAAVAAAQGAGATPAQLQSFTDLGTAVRSNSAALAAAVAANTPAAGASLSGGATGGSSAG